VVRRSTREFLFFPVLAVLPWRRASAVVGGGSCSYEIKGVCAPDLVDPDRIDGAIDVLPSRLLSRSVGEDWRTLGAGGRRLTLLALFRCFLLSQWSGLTAEERCIWIAEFVVSSVAFSLLEVLFAFLLFLSGCCGEEEQRSRGAVF
jgi:hypothetical protein